jgi:hypothetical protein
LIVIGRGIYVIDSSFRFDDRERLEHGVVPRHAHFQRREFGYVSLKIPVGDGVQACVRLA